MLLLKRYLIGLVLFILFLISFVVYTQSWPIATATIRASFLDGIDTTQTYLPITLNGESPTPTASPTVTIALSTSTPVPSNPTATMHTSTATPLAPTATVPTPTVTPTPEGPLTVFGAQVFRQPSSVLLTQAVEAKLSGLRYDRLFWSAVESVQGQRDWSQLETFEQDMLLFSENGLTPIVIVRSTPQWAQKVPNYYCSPMKEEALDEFADFMREAVTRYSQPPYNVIYWEIWNEPDIDSVLLNPSSDARLPLFGCWGDKGDPYYGGGYYGQMLKQVYPAMKEANPAVQVVIGGLNLDCDPTLRHAQQKSTAAPPEGQSCLPAKFLEGILQSGGGNYFDIVSYHGYAYWSPSFAFTGDWDLEHFAWKHRGGVILGKADFLREVLAQYGLNKPLLLTETSLACYDTNPYCQCNDPNTECLQEEFFDAQANYALRLYTRLSANGVLGGVWYKLNYNAWRHTDLLDRNGNPKPAYTTVQFLATLLEGATYSESLSTSTVEGYRFLKAETEYHIYWTNDIAISQSLSLPANIHAIYDKVGQQITPNGNSIAISFEPIILEIR